MVEHFPLVEGLVEHLPLVKGSLISLTGQCATFANVYIYVCA